MRSTIGVAVVVGAAVVSLAVATVTQAQSNTVLGASRAAYGAKSNPYHATSNVQRTVMDNANGRFTVPANAQVTIAESGGDKRQCPYMIWAPGASLDHGTEIVLPMTVPVVLEAGDVLKLTCKDSNFLVSLTFM
jgi:hypothetical protein